jgi:hypothetical protein
VLNPTISTLPPSGMADDKEMVAVAPLNVPNERLVVDPSMVIVPPFAIVP